MQIILAASVLMAAAMPSALWADGLSFGGNIAVTSNSISDGMSESGGKPAIQPFFEVSKNGFYGNAWASNIKDADGNTAALDLGVGYRGALAAGLSYDLGYTQHLLNKTRSRSAEVIGSLDFAATDRLTLSGELSYDLGARTLGEKVGAEFDLGKGWTVRGDVSKPDPSSAVVWGTGVGYDLNDKVKLDLQYQDAAGSRGLAALTMTYAFGNSANVGN